MHTFARIMVDLAHTRGIKAIVALRGGTAMSLAREFQPDAITLDVRLPDMSGWTLLDRLKHDPQTAHIPVHVISGHENNRRGFALGAMSCLQKDVSKESLEEVYRRDRAVDGSVAENAAADRRKRRTRQRYSRAAGRRRHRDSSRRPIWKRASSSWPVITSTGSCSIGFLPDERGNRVYRNRQAKSPTARAARSSFRARRQPLSEQQVAEIHNCARAGAVRYAPAIERVLEETVLLLHRKEATLSDEQKQRAGRSPAGRSGCWPGGRCW